MTELGYQYEQKMIAGSSELHQGFVLGQVRCSQTS